MKSAIRFVLVAVALSLLTLPGCGGGDEGGGNSGSENTPPPSFSPASGVIGSVVTLTGADYSSATGVTIGGVPALLLSQDSSQLKALVMPGAVTGGVSVTSSSGTVDTGSDFTVRAAGLPVTQQGPAVVNASSVGGNAALSADGNTALQNGGGSSAVYARSGGSWTVQAPPGTLVNGASLALSADGDTALVGLANSAAVFVRNGTEWAPQGPELTGSDIISGSYFGVSVALSADGNTAAVGRPFDASDLGAVWIFTRSGGAWTQQGSKLVGTSATGIVGQGASVALSADGNTLAVGGPNDSTSTGAVWIFTRVGEDWTQQGGKLIGAGASGFAQQGWAVALSAAGDTLASTGLSDDSSTGAVWVFTRSAEGEWAQQDGKLVGTDSSNANLGYRTGLRADGNLLAVSGANSSDRLWLFVRSEGEWTQAGAALIPSDPGAVDLVGQGMALSLDGETLFVSGLEDEGSATAFWSFVPAP